MASELAVVVGASRGIGLALSRALKAQGYEVIATCRSLTTELRDLNVTCVQGVDIGVDTGLNGLKDELQGKHVRLLVINSGVLGYDTLDTLEFSAIQHQFNVNALGPLRVVSALRGCMGRGSRIALISSKMASVEANTTGKGYGYRMSKAAANAAAHNLSIDLREAGIAVGLYHPGVVRTDMYREYRAKIGDQPSQEAAVDGQYSDGSITGDRSAAGLVEQFGKLCLENSGQFMDHNGQRIPW